MEGAHDACGYGARILPPVCLPHLLNPSRGKSKAPRCGAGCRGVDAVGRFKEAFVNVSQLTRELQDQIETMRTRGAPADERGRAVWEILTESTGSSIETKVRRFLAAMEEAALLDRIEGEGEVQYRQTLNAAVEMSLNFERQAFYLMPADETDGPPAEDAVVGMIEGFHRSGARSTGDVAAS